MYVTPPKAKLLPLTWFAMLIQVGSPSSVGCVPVTQSTILRSPVLVVSRLGWSSEMPRSTIPIVTPRPSKVGLASANWAAPVSPVGMYALTRGVDADGGVCGVG